VRHHLTIDRNLFGTTYYTLVGFHGMHVTAGVVVMLIVLGLALARRSSGGGASRLGVELVSWYWHFVDAVWVAVFTVVYLVGRSSSQVRPARRTRCRQKANRRGRGPSR
jgi:cytochrome c oxidase subunit 3/cytochrome o ubiquinol oxidase subunit 3